MHDLRKDLSALWSRVTRLPATGGGRAVMFMASRSGEGTSSLAASLALIAAERAQRMAWLIDLDLRQNTLFKGFQSGFAEDFGSPGRAYDASLRLDPIYQLTVDDEILDPQQKLLTAHRLGSSRLMVTRFRNERLHPGQSVELRDIPAWWKKLREGADWVIADAPALAHSPAGLTVAANMDGVVLVIEADKTSANEVATLSAEIEAHGGRVIGTVLNRTGLDARLAAQRIG